MYERAAEILLRPDITVAQIVDIPAVQCNLKGFASDPPQYSFRGLNTDLGSIHLADDTKLGSHSLHSVDDGTNNVVLAQGVCRKQIKAVSRIFLYTFSRSPLSAPPTGMHLYIHRRFYENSLLLNYFRIRPN